MGVQFLQYKESQLEVIRIFQNEFLSFITNEFNELPWYLLRSKTLIGEYVNREEEIYLKPPAKELPFTNV